MPSGHRNVSERPVCTCPSLTCFEDSEGPWQSYPSLRLLCRGAESRANDDRVQVLPLQTYRPAQLNVLHHPARPSALRRESAVTYSSYLQGERPNCLLSRGSAFLPRIDAGARVIVCHPEQFAPPGRAKGPLPAAHERLPCEG